MLSGERIFSKKEMKNHLNLHSLRAQAAKNTYAYLEEQLKQNGEEYRKKLENELREKWNKFNINPKAGKPRPFPENRLSGKYYLRGKSKEFAIKNNLPTSYDRLLVFYVSMQKLAHYRLGVTVQSYLMFVYEIPEWLVFVLFVIVCAVSGLAVLKAKTAVALVEGVEEKIKVQTQVFKSLIADAEHLLSTCKSAELKTEAKKVYEAIRYSDPMSNDALADIEGQIQSEFTFFAQAINSEDLELAKTVGEGLLNLIDSRNKKCKVLK